MPGLAEALRSAAAGPDGGGLDPVAPLGAAAEGLELARRRLAAVGLSIPFAAPVPGWSGRAAARDPASGACGGKPAAIRWRSAQVSGRSGLAGWSNGLPAAGGCPLDGRRAFAVVCDTPGFAGGGLVLACGATGGGPDSSTIVRSGCGIAGAAGEPAGLLFPGGGFFEFTAYLPASTPPWPQPPSLRIASRVRIRVVYVPECLRARVSRYRPRAPAMASAAYLARPRSNSKRNRRAEPIHINGEYGQR